MYKCQISGKVVGPRESAHKLVTKTRKKDYYGPLKDKEGKIVRELDGITPKLVKVGEGWEIVEEKIVCLDVYLKGNHLFTKET